MFSVEFSKDTPLMDEEGGDTPLMDEEGGIHP